MQRDSPLAMPRQRQRGIQIDRKGDNKEKHSGRTFA